jgi:hypothetical protein
MTAIEKLYPESELKVQVRLRPKYSCERCGCHFPSILDLREHERVDHDRIRTSG